MFIIQCNFYKRMIVHLLKGTVHKFHDKS